MKPCCKLLAVLAALVLVFSLCACSLQESVTGTWKYTMKLTEALDRCGVLDEIGNESGTLSEAQVQKVRDVYLRLFKDLDLILVLDLREDGRYTLQIEENGRETVIEQVDARLPELYPELLAAWVGVSVEKVPALLENAGTTIDDLIKSRLFVPAELVEKLDIEAAEGSYRFEDGKLVLTRDDSEYAAELTVELRFRRLTVAAIDAEDPDDKGFETLKPLLPLAFSR